MFEQKILSYQYTIFFLFTWIFLGVAQAQEPNVSLGVPAEAFIGEDVTITATFDNTSTAPGFGPFIDLVLPRNGADGAAGTATADGYTFDSAEYLGVSLAAESPTPQVFPDDGGGRGCLDHPLAVDTNDDPIEVCGVAGDQFVVLALPFGSFVPDQPPAEVEITLTGSNLADLGTPLDIYARGGFRFGDDELENPATDPTRLQTGSGNVNGDTWPTRGTVTPTLLELTKTYIGPELETATGPNFPRQYRLEVAIAPGQTITDLDIVDTLSDRFAFLSVDTISPSGTEVSLPPVGERGPADSNEIHINIPSVTGPGPVVVEFSYFVPRVDVNGVEIIPPNNGDDQITDNEATAVGDWDPIDTRDSGGTDFAQDAVTLSDGPPPINLRSIAIQKGVSVVGGGATLPGVTLKYALDIQISDFFAFDDLIIEDILSDGQRFDGSFDPILTIDQALGNSSTTINAANFDVVVASPGTGESTLTFRLSDELGLRSMPTGDGRLVGGCVPAAGTGGPPPDCSTFNGGATTAVLTYQATILDAFTDTFPSGDASVDQGDVLNNAVEIEGNVLDTDDATTRTGFDEADNSSAGVSIDFGSLSKTVYAINGSTTLPNPLVIRPGDEVTYRLTYTFATTDFEAFVLTDYLPLPVFDATQLNTTFSSAAPSATAPAVNQASYGPSATSFFTITSSLRPTITTDSDANSVRFAFGDFDDPQNRPSIADILFTLEVSDDPFADDLLLTNQVRSNEDSTNAGDFDLDAIVQIRLREPVLEMVKGVFSTDADSPTFDPAVANPTDSDVSGVDAGDEVVFRITIDNVGGAQAFQVALEDAIPAGLTCDNLQAGDVVNASGGNLPFTGGAISGSALNLNLTNPLRYPGEVPGDANVRAVVSLTCTVDNNVAPLAELTNAATVRFAASATATKFFPDLEDEAIVTIAEPTVAKSVADIQPRGAGGTDLITVGDIVTYEIEVTLPEGQSPSVVLRENLPDGLAFVPGSVTVNTTGFAGTVTSSPTAPTTAENDFDIEFGTVTVTDDNTTTNNSFTIRFDATVLDDGDNAGTDATQNKNNQVNLRIDSQNRANDDAQTRFAEPRALLEKEFLNGPYVARDTATIQLTLTNTGTAPLYDIVVTDALVDLPGRVDMTDLLDLTTISEGTTPAGYTFAYAGGTNTVTYTGSASTTLAAGASVVFSFTGTVRDDVVSGSAFDNDASVRGDTQEGSPASGVQREASDDETTTTNTTRATVDKNIVATSETATSDSNLNKRPPVAIGEVITVELVFGISTFETRNVQLKDNIFRVKGQPWGALVAGSAQLARSTTDLTSSVDPGGINSANAGVFVPVTVVEVNNGQQLRLDLGTVQNTGTGGETYTLRLDLVVRNITAINDGRVLNDRANFTFQSLNGNDITIQSPRRGVRVVEPRPSITKALAPQAPEGGDVVTYTLTIANAAAASATGFDWTFEDELPPELLSPALTTNPLPSGVTASFIGNTLSGTVDALAPGAEITLTYTATVDPNAVFGQRLINGAAVATTSLDGTGSAGQGATGSATGERTGSGGVNDLFDTAQVEGITQTPTITKTLLDPRPYYAIGDEATFLVTVGVPRGSTTNFRVEDALPSGLTPLPGSVNAMFPADITATRGTSPLSDATTGFVNLSANPLVFNFGDVVASKAANITVTYRARVDNVLANQDGLNLVNTAQLFFNDTGGNPQNVGPAVNDTSVRVGEPNLDMTKAIVAGSVEPQAGDLVRYQVTLINAGNTTAFQVQIQDPLPAGLVVPSGGLNPALVVNGDVFLNGTTTTPTNANIGATGTTVDFNTPLEIAPGSSVVVEFDAELAGVTAGQVIDNAVSASYDSQPTGADGRNGSNGGDDDDNSSGLNNYNESASQSLVVANTLAIDKTVSPTRFTVGDFVTFDLRVDVIQGVSPNLRVVDVLPPGLVFESALIVAGNGGFTFGNPSYATPQVSNNGRTVEFNFGEVVNPSDPDTSNDFILINLTAIVANVTANQNGTVLSNGEDNQGSGISASFDGPGGTVNAEFDSDPNTSGNQGVSITVIEPVLELQKRADPERQALGDVVTFEITVNHASSSTADAFDLELLDTLPAGLTYVPGSATLPATDFNVSGQNLTFRIPVLTLLDASRTIRYQAQVDTSAVADRPLTNNLRLSFASLTNATGAGDGGRNGDDGPSGALNDYALATDATVTPSTDAFVEAMKSVALSVDGGITGQVDPGDTLTYTVVLENVGTTPVTNAVFTDPVPLNTTYVPSSLTTTQGLEDESNVNNLSVAIGTIAPNSQVTITFQVTVDAGTPTGTVLSNQGSVDSDQTLPEPTDADGAGANGNQATTLLVGAPPTLTNALYVPKRVALTNDADNSGSVTPGDTLTYTLIFENRGAETLTNVTLSDTIPSGLTFVGGSDRIAGGNTLGVTGNVVSAQLPSLVVGATVVAAFDVTVNDPLFDSDATAATETFVNQGAIDSDQTTPSQTDGNTDPSDGNQPTPIAAVASGAGTPAIDAEKRVTLIGDADNDGQVDPGETLEYRVTIINTGSAEAFNVRFSDPVPADTTIVSGSVLTSQGTVLNENPVAVNIGTLAPGGLVTLRFQVTVDGAVADGTIISNQGSVTAENAAGTPLPPELTDDNSLDADGKNPNLTPVDSGLVQGRTSPGGLAKTLEATSEASSSGTQVLIGEVATFRLLVNVPPGLTREVSFVDTLPTGLRLLDNSLRLRRTFDTGLTASQNPAGVNGAASGTFVDLGVSDVAIDNANNAFRVFLGDLINSDNDANDETLTLEYQVLVENVVGNQAGTTLNNAATMTFVNGLNQNTSLTPVNSTLTVIEPNLTIDKALSPGTLLPSGGPVNFTFTVTNPAGSNVGPGFDVTLTDPIPAPYTTLSITSLTPSGGVTGVTNNSTADTLSVAIDTFPVDGQLVVQATATVPNGTNRDTFTNTAVVTATSLPGGNGTGDAAPGAGGASDGERTGVGSGTNDLTNSGSANLVVGGTVNFDKVLTSGTGRYAIGEVVSYRLDLSLPSGSLANVVVSDNLDPGLVFISDSLSVNLPTGVSATTPPATAGLPNGTTLSLDLGTLTNSQATTQTVAIAYQARVVNQLSNQNNDTLANGAALNFTDPGTGNPATPITDTVSITLGEPILDLGKTITSATTMLQAGDEVSFQVEVENSGTTTAFETLLTDALPSGLANVDNLSVLSTNGVTAPTLNGNDTNWNSEAFDLPAGARVTIAFTATLAVGVQPGEILQNAVQATFSSLDGNDANERDGSTANSEQSDGNLNNYNVEATSPSITVDNPVQFDKTFTPDATKTTYTLGETFKYRLAVAVLEGTLEEVVIVDTLPEGVAFVGASLNVGNTGITTNYSGTPTQNGQVLTFDLGDVVNPANASTSDDILNVDIDVQVLDITANVAGSTLGNSASLRFTDGQGIEQTLVFDADDTTAGTQPLEAEVVEPELTLSKVADPTSVSLGDEVTFTLTLDHTAASGTDAFDLVVNDILPAGLTYVAGSASLAPEVLGQTLRFELAALTLNEDNRSITYRARVDEAASAGVALTNTATLSYDTLPGVVSGERDYSDTAEAVVTPTTAAFIEAVKTVALSADGGVAGQVNPGDRLTYTIVLTNTEDAVTSVMFTDPIPQGTTYVSGSLASSVGSINDSDPDQLVVNVGDLARGDTVTITFVVEIDASVPEGFVISNQGVVNSDQTEEQSTDADGVDGNGDQSTTIEVGDPSPPVVLDAVKTVAVSVDNDVVGQVDSGDRLRYTVEVTNKGDAVTSVLFTDEIPSGTTYVSGSLASSVGVVNSSLGNLVVDIGDLDRDDTVTITFEVDIDAATPEGFVISNQGVVNSDQTEEQSTDADGVDGNGDQSTTIGIGDPSQPPPPSGPVLDVEKRAVPGDDLIADGLINPGEQVIYTVNLTNTGSATAQGVVFTDPVPINVASIEEVTTSQGAVISESPVVIELGNLVPGAAATITFVVRVDADARDGSTIINQAIVNGDNVPKTPSDDNGIDEDGKNPSVVVIGDPGLPDFLAPPKGIKELVACNIPTVEYRMVWYNPNNLAPLAVAIEDPIQSPGQFRRESLRCEARGDSRIDNCQFNPRTNTIEIDGVLASDFGVGDPNTTEHALIVSFGVVFPEGVQRADNQGFAFWDVNNNGSVDDEMAGIVLSIQNRNIQSLSLQRPIVTDDPSSPADGDPTTCQSPNTGGPVVPSVPAASLQLLILLWSGLLTLGMFTIYRRRLP